MKTKLLCLLLVVSAVTFAQDAIPSFYADGTMPNYIFATTSAPIDQSATGENVTYTFDQLVETGTSYSPTVIPNSEETTTYPNTTLVNKTTITANAMTTQSNIYFSDINQTVSITGAGNDQVSLNFSTNNATLGTFPLNFGYTNSDAVAGSFSYSTYNGTFTGTIDTSVDAYGTLSLNLTGLEPNTPISITRLKTVLSLSLTYIFPNVGTITQTTYSYYSSANPGYPIFRSTTNVINVPAANIDQTNTSYESFNGELLSTLQFKAETVVVSKNPVKNFLEINSGSPIQEILVFDLSGNQLKGSLNSNSVNVDGLSSGVYFAKVKVEGKVSSLKFIKE